jgi:hypothetical protein
MFLFLLIPWAIFPTCVFSSFVIPHVFTDGESALSTSNTAARVMQNCKSKSSVSPTHTMKPRDVLEV